jgi:hypothetical protein
MDASKKLDYISIQPYRDLGKVLRATNFDEPDNFSWTTFWIDFSKELDLVKTKIVILNRIGPYAPHWSLYSSSSVLPFFYVDTCDNSYNIVVGTAAPGRHAKKIHFPLSHKIQIMMSKISFSDVLDAFLPLSLVLRNKLE